MPENRVLLVPETGIEFIQLHLGLHSSLGPPVDGLGIHTTSRSTAFCIVEHVTDALSDLELGSGGIELIHGRYAAFRLAFAGVKTAGRDCEQCDHQNGCGYGGRKVFHGSCPFGGIYVNRFLLVAFCHHRMGVRWRPLDA